LRVTRQNGAMTDPQVVYLLWHGDDPDEGPNAKLLGVYSSEQAALDRINRSIALPGFAEYPEDFHISPYTIDQDEWTTGWVEAD
jgi:hypothetical protein